MLRNTRRILGRLGLRSVYLHAQERLNYGKNDGDLRRRNGAVSGYIPCSRRNEQDINRTLDSLSNANLQCKQSISTFSSNGAMGPVEAAVEFKLRKILLDRPECEPTFPDHLESVRRRSHVGRHGSAKELRAQADEEDGGDLCYRIGPGSYTGLSGAP
jgi:hypothetical protein